MNLTKSDIEDILEVLPTYTSEELTIFTEKALDALYKAANTEVKPINEKPKILEWFENY
jgi:hypothetical protein